MENKALIKEIVVTFGNGVKHTIDFNRRLTSDQIEDYLGSIFNDEDYVWLRSSLESGMELYHQVEKPIDRVTVTNLDTALRLCGIEIHKDILDKVIDMTELIEDKGDFVTLKDIAKLRISWSDKDHSWLKDGERK